MKQVLHNYETGRAEVFDLPVPEVKPGCLLIRSRLTLISSGTERSVIQASQKSLLQSVIEQPEKIRKALDRVESDGLLPTIDAVRQRSKQVMSIGYCNVGEVIAVGAGVEGYKVGDRVVSNGSHAEIVCVPVHLCAVVPQVVSDEDAVFTILGSIGLQGVRLLEPTLGESFAVIGLGSIGLLAVQILRAHGCRVLAVDPDSARRKAAEDFGAAVCAPGDAVVAAKTFSREQGIDGALITASTSSNEPLHQAATMCRKRGRIVLTGVIGPELSRADFYEKELSFRVSCSYGPGRYDSSYEQMGRDYPLPYVRWTEQRNFVAFLDLLSDKKIHAAHLISHLHTIDEADKAYAELEKGNGGIALALKYPGTLTPTNETRRVRLISAPAVTPVSPSPCTISFVGAGNFGAQVLIPSFRRTGAKLLTVADRGGFMSWFGARTGGAEEATTNIHETIKDSRVQAVVIATRHDSHADLVCAALAAGKHVFVEKPLALTSEQLGRIERHTGEHSPILMVGFNRRFAPHVQKVKALVDSKMAPVFVNITVNAGFIPKEHWIHDPQVGGGRLIGEGCHFIDLIYYFSGSTVTRVQATPFLDGATVVLEFSNGSRGTVNYITTGHKSYPKEIVEVFNAGRVFKIDNFRKLRAYGHSSFRHHGLWRQDKGHDACAQSFVDAVHSGKPSPISFSELRDVTLTTFAVAEQLKQV